MKKFIEYGADPTLKDFEGQSLLHLSAIYSNLVLLSYFAKDLQLDINCKDNDGRTALHTAALESKEQSCTILIALSKNFEIKDNDGFTPLQLAAISGNYRIIRHLILRGASRTVLSPLYNAENIGKIMTIPEEALQLLKQPLCYNKFNPIRPPIGKAKNSI